MNSIVYNLLHNNVPILYRDVGSGNNNNNNNDYNETKKKLCFVVSQEPDEKFRLLPFAGYLFRDFM